MPKVISCGMSQSQLTKKLFESNLERYCFIKSVFWVNLYNDRMRPTKWNKPTSSGTKCTCVPIVNETELEAAKLDLKNYCDQCNEKYPKLLQIDFKDGSSNV